MNFRAFLFALISHFVFASATDLFAAKATVADCPTSSETHFVVCGPLDPNAAQVVVEDARNHRYNNVTIFQGWLLVTNNSSININQGGLLFMDPGGCVERCDTNTPVLGTSILELNFGGIFSHVNEYNSLTKVKDNIRFIAKNSSILLLGKVSDEGAYATTINIDISNSTSSFNNITLSHADSKISGIFLSNSIDKKGLFKTNINEINGVSIRAPAITTINLTNTDLIIAGSVITEGKNALVGTVLLNNSNIDFAGTLFSKLNVIRAVDKSVFTTTKSNSILQVGSGAPAITAERDSQITLANVEVDTATYLEIIAATNSIIKINRIYIPATFDDQGGFRIAAEHNSTVDIGIIDTRTACATSCINSDLTFRTAGNNAFINIGSIFINNDKKQIKFISSYFGNIKNIEYSNDLAKIEGLDKNSMLAKIDNIKLTSVSSTANVNIKNSNLEINNFNLLNSSTSNFVINNSNLKIDNLVCVDLCNTINFSSVGTAFSNLNIKNFINSPSNTSVNNFKDINMNITGSYTSSGVISLNNAKLVFNSLSGNFTNILLTNSSSFTINEESNINLSSINIENGSSIFINASNVLQGNNIVVANSGIFTITKANNFNSLNNTASAKAFIDGNATINNINNSGELSLSANSHILELNNAGTIHIHNVNQVDTLRQSGGNLSFYIDTKESKAALQAGSITEWNVNKLDITFKDTAVLNPGESNRYYILSTKTGAINPNTANHDWFYNNPNDLFDDALSILPHWLVNRKEIVYNNGVDSKEGETIGVNIQRLTSYTALIQATPGYSGDKGLLSITRDIDHNVANSTVSKQVLDIINSLDMNSGCVSDQEFIYGIHQGTIQNINAGNTPCLYTMASNAASLKPVSHETYALTTHINTVKSFEKLAEANKEYTTKNDLFTWISTEVSYLKMNNKNYNNGYNSTGSTIYGGLTAGLTSKFTLSALFAFGISDINGDKSAYDGRSYNSNSGFALTYLSNKYHFTFMTLLANNNYNMNRHIKFLDNRWSENKNTEATAKIKTTEIAVRAEVGREFIINNATYLTPKLFISQGFINVGDYTETNSSASLYVVGTNYSIADFGLSLEYYKEILFPKFLGIKNAFWYPKASIAIVERFYTTKDTQANFIATNSTISIPSPKYSAPLINTNLSLMYQQTHFSLQVGYYAEAALSGYMSHSIVGNLKYSF